MLISGCHYAYRHYINANGQTLRRVQHLWDTLEREAVRPDRLPPKWISAAEGQKVAKVMRQLEQIRKTVTLEDIARPREALKPKPRKAASAKTAAVPAGWIVGAMMNRWVGRGQSHDACIGSRTGSRRPSASCLRARVAAVV